MALHIKRVYEPPEKKDGFRVLVDRLWPRGMKKETAAIDLWLKDVAPSTALRQWFGHEKAKWPTFKKRYIKELQDNTDATAPLLQALTKGTVTLLYGAKDENHNQAVVLKYFLDEKQAPR